MAYPMAYPIGLPHGLGHGLPQVLSLPRGKRRVVGSLNSPTQPLYSAEKRIQGLD